MLKIPLYDQLTDLLPDGQPDPYSTTDCGSECVSMVLDALGYGGIPGLSAGQVRVIIRRGDLQGYGLTSADDLCYGLYACGRIPSHARTVNFGIMKIEVQRAYDAHLPTILLGTWDSPSLHWIVPVQSDSWGLICNDPWGGQQKQLSWSDIPSLYSGVYVHVDRPIS